MGSDCVSIRRMQPTRPTNSTVTTAKATTAVQTADLTQDFDDSGTENDDDENDSLLIFPKPSES